jgi:hypothetical protein
MVRKGWTEDEIKRVSMRQFVKNPVADLVLDPKDSDETQRRVYGRNVVYELQARIDAATELKESSLKRHNPY